MAKKVGSVWRGSPSPLSAAGSLAPKGAPAAADERGLAKKIACGDFSWGLPKEPPGKAPLGPCARSSPLVQVPRPGHGPDQGLPEALIWTLGLGRALGSDIASVLGLGWAGPPRSGQNGQIWPK